MGTSRRFAGIALLLTLFVLGAPSGARASQDSVPLGIAPVRAFGATAAPYRTSQPSTTARSRRGNLLYHGGAILASSTTHAIFWNPFGDTSFPAGYTAAITTYFDDIAHDSGLMTNVYSIAEQYFDRNPSGTIRNHVNYDVFDGGAVFPTDPITETCTSSAPEHCVTDSQIHQEITSLFPSTGSDDVYFVFLPPNVDTCDSEIGCMAAGNFCAYHSAFSVGGNRYLYANEPFADVDVAGGTCRTGEEPVGSQADATLNTISHEHNEINTDPFFGGWYARSGAENGDKCAYRFGSPLGGTVGADAYNQVINSHSYYLQQEWSNSATRCGQRAGP